MTGAEPKSEEDMITLTREKAEALEKLAHAALGMKTQIVGGHEAVAALRELLKPKRVESTPGPWNLHTSPNQEPFFHGPDREVVTVFNGGAEDARLIAAAPDFYLWAKTVILQGGHNIPQKELRQLRRIVEGVQEETR